MKIKGVAACGFAAVAVAGGLFLCLGGKPTERFSEADAGFDRAAPPDEAFLASRLTYPTGRFDPAWVLQAVQQDQLVLSALPAGERLLSSRLTTAVTLDPNAFTPLGPQPLNNTQESYGNVSGRANVLIVDPVDNATAYFGSDGGGVWKTTNCCSDATTWKVTTDVAQVASMAIDDIVIDPNDHNVVYAATGDLNYGSFSFGTSGVLKSTDQGNTWTVLGAEAFTPAYTPANAAKSAQYQSVGKIAVDPNNSRNLAAGTKTGVYFSYDAGQSWTGPCYTNPYTGGSSAQRQDITGLLAVNSAGRTLLYAAVGTRGAPTPIQPDLANNGANGVYRTPMPGSGCPAVADWSLLNKGWEAGTGNGSPGPRGRIELAVAPGNPKVLYAEVADASARNVRSVYSTADGGDTWSPKATASNIKDCGEGNSAGGGTQMWYDAHLLVNPTDPNAVWLSGFDLFRSSDGGASFSNVTCGWTTAPAGSIDHVHVDHHASTFVGKNPNQILIGSDGGVFYSANAAATSPGFRELNNSVNTIEIYSGDITANFATSSSPAAAGGFQDNGSGVVTYSGKPGAALWQEVGAGDGMFSRIEPVLGNNWYYSVYYGQINESTQGPLGGNVGYVPDQGAWGPPLISSSGQACDDTSNPQQGERRSFLMPFDIYRYGDTGAAPPNGCDAANGCTHLIAGSCRVWETTTGHFSNSAPVTGDLTKGNLVVGTDNRSYINQLHYSFSDVKIAIAGTSDGNVQYIYGLGNPATAKAVDVTGGNAVLPNRQVLNVATDPVNPWVGYAAMGGFDQNTPTTPGHVFRVTCTNTPPPLGSNCATFVWENKTGNLPNIPVEAILPNPKYPQQVFAGTDWGLYFTNDITAASPVWFHFEGMPHVMIWDMVIDRGYTTLALFTRSRGAWAWPLPSAPIGSGSSSGGGSSSSSGSGSGSSSSSSSSSSSGSSSSSSSSSGSTSSGSSSGGGTQAPEAHLQATPVSGTAPLLVNFDASASRDPNSGGGITSYAFDYGDGQHDTVSSGKMSHTYQSAGSYTAMVTVTDSEGGTARASVVINAQSAQSDTPAASLSVSTTSGLAPLAVSFDASGSHDARGSITNYLFNFGDGSTPVSQATPGTSYTYSAAGTYQASVTVTNSFGRKSAAYVPIQVTTSVSVTPSNAPVAELVASPSSGSAPLTVTLDGSHSYDPDGKDSIASYSFDFGDGSAPVTQTGAAINHVYTQAGTYSPSLTVTDSAGTVSPVAAVAKATVNPATAGGTGGADGAGGAASGGGAIGGAVLLPLMLGAALRRRRRTR